jgi:hypothetical protein
MGMFCQNLMIIALELARHNPVYEGLATKFFEHYIYVGAAMKHMGTQRGGLWSEKDGFFYDLLRFPDGSHHRFRVRSLVGLIPLYAVERLEEDWIADEDFKRFRFHLHWFLKNRQDLVQRCCYSIHRGGDGQAVHVLAVVNEDQLRRILQCMWDESEFRSPFGLRSLSKYHQEQPFLYGDSVLRYEPAESQHSIKGGNSNWRGPVWFPTTYLMIDSLRKLAKAYGPSFKLNDSVTLNDMAQTFADGLISIFTRDADGRRPVFGGSKKFQEDPHWRDNLLFYEYFHGDNGAGIGASHQTGWTALVAVLIDEWRR